MLYRIDKNNDEPAEHEMMIKRKHTGVKLTHSNNLEEL